MTERRKKALIIAYYFPPLGSSGTFRTLKFVKYLERYGWDSVVVTVAPEYEILEPIDESLSAEIPASTVVFRTYAWQPNRILARRFGRSRTASGGRESKAAAPAPLPGRKSSLRARAGALLRAFGRGGWYPFALAAALKAIRTYDIDVVYTSAPPFASSLVGATVKRITGKPLVSDFRDPWGSNTYHDGQNPLMNRLSLDLERSTFKASERIINISADLEAKAKERSPARIRDRFVVIPNGYDPEDFPAPPAGSHRDEFRITYTGCFYSGSREPFNFIRSLAVLRDRDAKASASIRAHFVGEPGWADEHREWLNTLGLGPQIAFHPFLPHRRAVDFLYDSDVLLMLGSVKAADTGSLPAKLFEYLAVGKPILALVHDGESARFVRDSGIGVVANPEQPEEIASAVSKLFDLVRSGQFGAQVNRELLDRHDRRALTGRLATLFDAVTSGR